MAWCQRRKLKQTVPSQATNEVITRVPECTQAEMQAAVDSCANAFKSWSQTTVLTRQQILFRYADLVRKNLVSVHLMGEMD